MNEDAPAIAAAEIRILVADADAEIGSGLARLLEQAGYTTVLAQSGEEALQSMQTSPSHLVLLDRDLLGIDGVDVCRRIKGNPAVTDVLVIIISGTYTQSEDQAAEGVGGLGLLQATDARATYVVNVDARGASDPDATAALVQRAVAETLGRLVPGIVSQAASTAYGSVVDQLHRRGGKF